GINESKMPTRKGPKAAIAEVQPMTPPAWCFGKIMGICLKVPAFPRPVKKNIANIAPRNHQNCCGSVGLRNKAATAVKMVMPRPPMKVQMAPPNLRSEERRVGKG